jgi:hypothetical protein
LDGYTSATAQNYSGTNSPVMVTWNCRDANNRLVVDGTYKFWVQYAEDSGQGPYTNGGLLWTKGPVGATNTYSNQGANFANMKVAWTPASSPPMAPTITSAPPTASAIVGVPYSFVCTATGSLPIIFTASGLPPGLAISTAGLISGIPTMPGAFSGAITATNGTLPNATQSFSIAVTAAPVSIAFVRTEGGNLILSGRGPADGIYTVLMSTNISQAPIQWLPVATNAFDRLGNFGFTNAIQPGSPWQFYMLRVP